MFAEFDGDADAIAELNAVDDPDDLPYVAERIRQDRADTAKRTEIITDYTSKGIAVVDGDDYTRLQLLTDAAGDSDERPSVDPDGHQTCPGHAVVVQVWRGGQDIHVTPVCTTPDAHQRRWPHTESHAAQSGPMTEEQKTERKELIANNKAWDAAEVVRRDWVTTLLSRKTLPKDAALFLARTLTGHRQTVAADDQTHAHQRLGIERQIRYGINALDGYATENPTKAGQVSLAVAISPFENASNRNWWRHPTRDAESYLTALEAWGYHLSPTERIASGHNDTGDETATQTEDDLTRPSEPGPAD